MQTFILSGVRAAKTKFSPALLQPMSVVELVAYFKENAAMHRVREMTAGLVFQKIPFELRRGAVALFLAEICRKTIREEESNPILFDFLLKTLDFLDQTDQPIANLHLHFLLHLTSFLGFLPHGEASKETPFFDLQEGFFVETKPAHPFFMNETESSAVQKLLESSLENCHEIALPKPLRKAILTQLLKFYQLHIDHFREVHTPEILEMVLEN